MSTYIRYKDHFVSDNGSAAILIDVDNFGRNYIDVPFDVLEKIYNEALEAKSSKDEEE